MIRVPATPSAVLAAALVAACALGFAGCAKKITRVDSNFVPEGSLSADAHLLLFPDAPAVTADFTDSPPSGPGPEDTLVARVDTVYFQGPGVIRGMVLDHTSATGYQMLRREEGGGYRAFEDFLLTPSSKWLDQEWEAYLFSDPNPAAFTPPTYQGRGIVTGGPNRQSPLTNTAALQGADVLPMPFSAPHDSVNSFVSPPDTLGQVIYWNPVAGVAQQLIQLFQFNSASAAEILRSSLPAPIYIGRSHDSFISYAAPGTNGLLVRANGDVVLLPEGSQGQLITKRHLADGQFLLHVTGLDANGRLVGMVPGDFGVLPGAESGTFKRYVTGVVSFVFASQTSHGAFGLRGLAPYAGHGAAAVRYQHRTGRTSWNPIDR